MQDLFLQRNSSDEMVTLVEQAVRSALQFEAKRNRLQKQLLQKREKEKTISENFEFEFEKVETKN